MNVGVCRHCESRSGGRTYRRPLPCAKRLLENAPTYAMATVDCWSVRSLRRAVEQAELETP